MSRRGAQAARRALLTGVALLAASVLTAGAAWGSQRFPAQGEVEVAFSPRDDTEKVLIDLIRSARKSLKVHAYAFTSRQIAALSRASDTEPATPENRK